VIVPVGAGHVGCVVTLAVGTAGVTGWAFIVKLKPVDVQPTPFVVVKLYVPGVTSKNAPVVFMTATTAGLIPVKV
jgi:hypothetical protein